MSSLEHSDQGDYRTAKLLLTNDALNSPNPLEEYRHRYIGENLDQWRFASRGASSLFVHWLYPLTRSLGEKPECLPRKY